MGEEMSSISGILRKAIEFSLKTKKLMLHVFVIVLSPFVILVLLHSLIATPLMAKVEDSYEKSSIHHQDVVSLVVTEIPFAFAFSLVLSFAVALTILATVSTHKSKSLGLKEMLHSTMLIWSKILVSGLCLSVLLIALIGVTIILTRLNALLGVVLAALSYPYSVSICTLTMLISILEDDEYQGRKVFQRAGDIMGQKRLQGYVLMFVLVLLSVPEYILLYVTSTDDDDENGPIARSTFLLIATTLFCLTVCFNTMVYTLLFLECKQIGSEKVEELGTLYHSVPTLNDTDG